MEALAGIARQVAAAAIDDAVAHSGDASKIEGAEAALADGDTLRESDRFKDAVARYKDALARAEGAV